MPVVTCKDCGKKRKHMAKGLCNSCYLRRWRKRLSSKEREFWRRYKQRWHKQDLKCNPLKYRRRREARYHGGSRQKVLVRDRFTCTVCGKKQKPCDLIAHHKDMTGRYDGARLHGAAHEITVCRICHIAIHRRQMQEAWFGVKHHGWSCLHSRCIKCGTTKVRHYARGLCHRCWNSDRYFRIIKFQRQQKRRMKIQSNLHGDMQRPKAKRA
jgi:hypothetical protein